ncbi:MAG: protein-glutamate O-methyltransferase CheR, partial [Hyphomonadaceae bacterium]
LYLVASRLGPVAQALGLRGVIELMKALREAPSEAMIAAVVEAMMTHETLFFRDAAPFEQLQRVVLPALIRARSERKQLRIWSAACSTGQEAYSIAMLLTEMGLPALGWRCEIVGGDISRPIVERARAGVFSAFEMRRGLSAERIARHARLLDDGGYQMSAALRAMTRFLPHNILESAAHLGMFDITFCRNVLIYFDGPTRERALNAIARQTAVDGVLFLGSAEAILSAPTRWTAASGERGLYRLAPPPARRAS